MPRRSKRVQNQQKQQEEETQAPPPPPPKKKKTSAKKKPPQQHKKKKPRGHRRSSNLAECLHKVGVTPADLVNCDSIDQEFSKIKKAYFAKILTEHPDKGGDPEQFRSTNAAFQVLRELKSIGTIDSFHETVADASGSTDFDFAASNNNNNNNNDPDDNNIPSYEYYYEAAQEVVPGYKVENARSNRSQCVKCKSLQRRAKKKQQETEDTNPRNRIRMTEEQMNEALARTTTNIPMNELRVGSLNEDSGGYGRWHRLPCWRVPKRVWLGLSDPENEEQVLRDLIGMEEVLLMGVAALDTDDQARFVEHVMNKGNWAAYERYKRLKAQEEAVSTIAETEAAANTGNENPQPNNVPSSSASAAFPDKEGTSSDPILVKSDAEEVTVKSTAAIAIKREAEGLSSAMIVPGASENAVDNVKRGKKRFRIPVPGKNGAIPECLDGLRFVLTGIFPEVGGGIGLNLGKDKVKKMIEDFGGRVTGSVSGKTNFVIVGKEPGRSKVEAGESRNIPLVDLTSLNNRILGQLPELEDAKPAVIADFSEGYKPKRIKYTSDE